jgi:hypothetical protein
MILDSSVGRARVGCQERVWVGAITRQAPACKEEQHPQARSWRLNRGCSSVTHQVKLINAEEVSVHRHLLEQVSGQLRNLG